MASGITRDLCPDLKELERKIGRKTPESLLVSMRDHAGDGDQGLVSDPDQRRGDRGAVGNGNNDSFSDKIEHLKGEMRCLRRADVQILWQLVAVHEGLEALRWLEEERGGTLTSGASSLTGSQTSLGTAEGACWPSLTPSRNSPVPGGSQDSTPGCSPPREEAAGVLPSPHGDADNVSNRKGQSLPSPSLQPGDVRSSTLGPLGSERQVRDLRWSGSGRNNRTRASSTSPYPGDSVCAEKPHSQAPSWSQDYKKNSQTIRKALDRSMNHRLKVGSGGGLAPTNDRGETKTQGGDQRNSGKQVAEDERSALSAEKALFGYDAQWCWVESQDDVTFL
ncbi:unnamed protein product [Merluccius merluccius]